ncbi:sulfotransferase domain-containing protein [Mucilaginibacter sp. FT3.2]|uniref:sulfotransferase domain-containing protein n=1 Tax=Mucilaginibacter sp. FT3.2 TaxID=2723090 RepID=UPI0016166948|nr:sulfotransferase domain-containing protein [Mucilaginibacter sp. FT3.2]MBB6232340.1 hypothetical protein [Mucilaginibacter sp. FT3.2]
MGAIKIENWIPYKLITVDGLLQCHWLNTYGNRFTEPFFDETILKCRSAHARNYTFPSVSNLEMVKAWAQDLNEVEPAAFIFHISRCGSTLVSQLLATSIENIVLSEVPFFDDILRLPFKEPYFKETEINNLLTTAFKYYSQAITSPTASLGKKEKHLFIKADSWHIFFYKQLRQLYPKVPFILIYRRPDEVFKSHSKMPGMQAVPGMLEPQLFGFKAEEIGHNPGIYLANVLTSYLSKYLEIAASDNNCLFLNYNEGPMQMIKKVAAFSSIRLSMEDLQNMEKRSHYHSKKPGEHFSEEALTDAPSYLNEAMELYDILDEKRIAMQ